MVKTFKKALTKVRPKRTFKLTKTNSGKGMTNEKAQIKNLCEFIDATLASVGCPSNARKSYTQTLSKRLNNEGFGFLKRFRSLFIQGVKTLGGDTPSFEGFRLKNGYPRLFNWVFRELERLQSCKDCDPYRIRALLTVLYSAKSIRLNAPKSVGSQALKSFKERVSRPDYTLGDAMQQSDHVLSILEDYVKSIPKLHDTVNQFSIGSVFDPAKRGQKRCKIWKNKEFQIPRLLARTALYKHADGRVTTLSKGAPFFVEADLPIGGVNLLTEKGGKQRVIVSYNGFIHALDLYDRVRALLDLIPQDCSADQTKGHGLAQAFTIRQASARKLALHPTNQFTERRDVVVSKVTKWTFLGPRSETVETIDVKPIEQDIAIVSCDLSSFTDLFTAGSVHAALWLLKCANLYPLVTEGHVEMPDGEVITPRVPLMGFKGCFELASLLHNAFVSTFVTGSYAMCGDDVVGFLDLGVYERAMASIGLKLNRAKTVVSKDTSVFCGKVYFRGHDVSPMIPSIDTIINGDFREAYAAMRAFSDYQRFLYPCQRSYLRRFLKQSIRRFKKYISLRLPTKLGGLGLDTHSGGLISLLERRQDHVVASNSVPFEDEPTEIRSVNTLPGIEPTGEKVKFTNNLYHTGGTQLPRKPKVSNPIPHLLVGFDDIYDYFHTGKPLPSTARLQYICDCSAIKAKNRELKLRSQRTPQGEPYFDVEVTHKDSILNKDVSMSITCESDLLRFFRFVKETYGHVK